VYSKTCVDVSSSEINPGIQFQVPGIETMNEYALCRWPIAKAENCRIDN